MEQLRCTYCGGALRDRGDYYICESCRTKIKKSAMERLSDQDIFDLNAARRLKETFRFDEAETAYDEVLRCNPDCEEAAWGAFLAEYGIEYQVEEQKPTFHALSDIPGCKSRYYGALSSEHKAEVDRKIEPERLKIMRSVATLPVYDVFLSLKINDEDERRTPEHEWAMQLYYDLEKQGYRVFLSTQVLQTANFDWEPHIYRAIQTCRIMLVLTSSIDNANSPWVRNEWRRILSRIKNTPQRKQAPNYRVIARDVDCVPAALRQRQVILRSDYDFKGLVMSAVEEACASSKNAETRTPVTKGLIQVPRSLQNIKNIPLLKELLRDAGFTNIRDFPLHDMDGSDGYPWKEGSLASIMVAGADYNFDENAKYFDPATPVLITYHCVSEEAVAERKNREEAERKAREEATQNAADWFKLGQNAYNAQNYTEAVKWYRKAAEQGDAEAQLNLGLCYKDGEGVKQDNEGAVKWYRKAADQGLAQAQNLLALCYKNGEGVRQDNMEAFKWCRKAAEQGDSDAQFNLALCYEDGEGVRQDKAEAAKWYRMAAEQGNATAQLNLGLCYENGEGVKQDNAEAVRWYRKAAEQGDADAKKSLKRLGVKF